jgi:hypothetical protein
LVPPPKYEEGIMKIAAMLSKLWRSPLLPLHWPVREKRAEGAHIPEKKTGVSGLGE